jgi:hypothetical protein
MKEGDCRTIKEIRVSNAQPQEFQAFIRIFRLGGKATEVLVKDFGSQELARQ